MNHSPSKDQEPSTASDPFVGRVIGTEDDTPLEFWVALAPSRTLQLDGVVELERMAPGREPIRNHDIVTQIRQPAGPGPYWISHA